MLLTRFITIALLSSQICAKQLNSDFRGLELNFPFQFGQFERELRARPFNDIFQTLSQLNGNQDSTTSLIGKFLFSKIPTAFSDKVGEQCRNDSLHYLNAVLNFSEWALKMYDASQVSTPGEFSSIPHAMGHFDQCLSTGTDSFRGKYCTAFYTLTKNLTSANPSIRKEASLKGLLSIAQLLGLKGDSLDEPAIIPNDYYSLQFSFIPSVAFCLPSTCNGSEVLNAFADLVGSYSISTNESQFYTSVYAGDDFCFVEEEEPLRFNSGDIAMITILSIIGLLVLTSTIYEMTAEYLAGEPILSSPVARNHKYIRYLCAFSLVNNCRKLLSTRTNEGSLGCIHGIRFLSMTWVVMGHTWSSINNGNNLNTVDILKRVHNWFMYTLLNATVSVDTFLVLSGLLASFLLFIQLDKSKGRFNPLLLYLHRYLRLTPVYAILLGFNATLVVYLSTGPFWQTVRFYAAGCKQLWWQKLLYVNNLMYTRDALKYQCMEETWYIAVDMQLFLVLPLIVYPIHRWRVWGLLWLALLTVASFAGNIYIHLTKDPLPSLMVTRTDGDAWATNEVYIRPWYRAPAYFVGIFVGWALFKTRRNPLKLPKMLVILGWATAIAVACSVLYGLTPYATEDTEIPQAVTVLYGCFHRFAWSAAIGWMVFACVNGYGGFVDGFLSWKAFVPLGRLTYCVYLIHLNLLVLFTAHQRTQFYHTDFNTFYFYLGTLMTSLGLAFIVAVTIETPFLMLEKLLITQKIASKPQKRDDLETISAEPDKGLDNGHHNTAFSRNVNSR